MYGREYLDWCDKSRIAERIDVFLADMTPEDRKWALAILRERHTVYKNGGDLGALLRQSANAQNWHSNQRSQLQAALDRERPSGGLLSIFGL